MVKTGTIRVHYNVGDILVPIYEQHKDWGERIILHVLKAEPDEIENNDDFGFRYIWCYPHSPGKDFYSGNGVDPEMRFFWKLKED